MRFRPGLSLRTKFILIVLGGAVLPLAVLGVWLNQTAERSGERLLRSRLESSLSQIVDGIGLRWLNRRSQLLRLVESTPIQGALGNGWAFPAPGVEAPPELRSLFASMVADFEAITVRDSTGGPLWTLNSETGSASGSATSDPTLNVRIGIHQTGSGERIGALEARVRMNGSRV